MPTYFLDSASGAAPFAVSTAYAVGAKMVIALGDTGANYLVARAYIWECTTAGTSDTVNPTWPATVTADTTTVTSGTAVFTARSPLTWANAAIYLLYAIASAGASGDVVKVSKTHIEPLTASTTYTFGAKIAVICVDKTAADAPAIMDGTAGYIGHKTAGYNITISGTGFPYLYGISFNVAAGGSSSITLGGAGSAGNYIYDNCRFDLASNTNAGARLFLGTSATNSESWIKLIKPSIVFGSTGQRIAINQSVMWVGGQILDLGILPATLFVPTATGSADLHIEGADLYGVTGMLFDNFTTSILRAKIINTRIRPGVTVLADQTALMAGAEVWLHNTSSGNFPYAFGHYNALGSTVAELSPYANDGAKHDGVEGVVWKIAASTNASIHTPYVSPWIDRYYKGDGTTAITPSLEILRNDSATALTDAQVWGEWSFQAAIGPQSSFVNDGMALLGSAAVQDAGSGLANWTGASATAWSGKLVSPSITPANYAGYIRARVCVGYQTGSLYVDPLIRGVV